MTVVWSRTSPKRRKQENSATMAKQQRRPGRNCGVGYLPAKGDLVLLLLCECVIYVYVYVCDLRVFMCRCESGCVRPRTRVHVAREYHRPSRMMMWRTERAETALSVSPGRRGAHQPSSLVATAKAERQYAVLGVDQREDTRVEGRRAETQTEGGSDQCRRTEM